MGKAGKLSPIPRKPDDEITQEDINKAIEKHYESLRNLVNPPKKEDIKSKNNSRYLTVQMLPEPNSPFPQIREGKPIKVKTVFHSVDVEIIDDFGGKFSSIYEIKETVEQIAELLKTSFPNYSKVDIEKLSEESGRTYEETKALLIKLLANQIVEGRVSIARFFHKEIEEALKIVIDDLITDAQFYALSLLGYQFKNFDNPIKKMLNRYEKRRKERAKIIKGKGRPQGKSLTQEELDDFFERFKKVVQDLETKKQKITKTAIARKLYIGHSNSVQQLNRFFDRYGITFEEMLEEYRNEMKK